MTRFYSAAIAKTAHEDFVARFQKGAIPENLPEHHLDCEEGKMSLVQVLKQTQLTSSSSEAQRMLDQGGVRVDGEKVSDRSIKLKAGNTYVLQVGKRKIARVHLQSKQK